MSSLIKIARRAFPWSARASAPSQRSASPAPRQVLAERMADPQLRALIPIVREKLKIDEAQASDADIELGLRAIQARADQRGRWLAAFNSKVGQVIAGRGPKALTALHTLVAQVPERQR